MRSPKRLLPEILCVMMRHGVDTDDEARDKVYSFIKELKSLNIINKDHYMDVSTEKQQPWVFWTMPCWSGLIAIKRSFHKE